MENGNFEIYKYTIRLVVIILNYVSERILLKAT